MTLLVECLQTNKAAIVDIDEEIRRLQRAKRHLQKAVAHPIVFAPLDNVTVQQATWAHAGQEVHPLFNVYWAEIRGDSQPEALDVNLATYAAHEAAGSLVLVVARDGRKVIGFTMFFVFVHHHYQSTLAGHEDAWYVLPAYRRGMGVGLRLLRVAIQVLTTRGCTHAYVISTTSKDMDPLLRRLRFTPVETVHCLALQGGDG